MPGRNPAALRAFDSSWRLHNRSTKPNMAAFFPHTKWMDGPVSPIHSCQFPPKTDVTVDNPPFEDAFPTENRDFPMSC